MKAASKWGAAAAIFGLAVVAASFPMRLALDWGGAAEAGLSARSVEGSVWGADLHDLHWGGLALGSVRASVSPWSVMIGAPRLAFARRDDRLGMLSGNLSTGREMGLVDAQGRVELGMQFGGLALGGLQMQGVTALADREGRCVKASGQVQLRLNGPMAGLALADGLSGPISCGQGRFRASLASQSGMERLIWEADGKGAWTARLSVAQVRDPAMVMALGQMGFRPSGDGYVMAAVGRF